MKRPHKRLNFNSHGSPVTIFSSHAEDREKASMKTPLVARQGNYILELTDLEKVLYDDAVIHFTQPSGCLD